MNKIDISPRDAADVIDLIGRRWMLIGAAEGNGRANAMTASWGAMGELWGLPVAICFIRPQRHTFGLVENNERLSLSFFGDEKKDALRFCGSRSGRDGDKLADAGLRYETVDGAPVFDDARLTLICRKLYTDNLNADSFIVRELIEKNYPEKDFHRFYICGIERCLKG